MRGVKETYMVEILFGESEAASMKAAKNKIVIGSVDGPTSVGDRWTVCIGKS